MHTTNRLESEGSGSSPRGKRHSLEQGRNRINCNELYRSQLSSILPHDVDPSVLSLPSAQWAILDSSSQNRRLQIDGYTWSNAQVYLLGEPQELSVLRNRNAAPVWWSAGLRRKHRLFLSFSNGITPPRFGYGAMHASCLERRLAGRGFFIQLFAA